MMMSYLLVELILQEWVGGQLPRDQGQKWF